MLIYILIATFLVGAVSLVGSLTVGLSQKKLKSFVYVLVAFSAGTLLAGGLMHLLAESLESLEQNTAFIILLIGFSLFFIMEKFFYWHHCHEGVCEVHPYTSLILIGDGLHNFIDGIVIGVSFIVSLEFGIITTILIITHEIPQELADFGVLVQGGLKVKRALTLNLFSQLTAVLGGLIGYMLSGVEGFIPYLLPFAAGGFIYISTSDLIPELHKEYSKKRSILSFAFFLMGLSFMVGTKLLFD
jgi:zinc and cadmium transporter